MGKGHLKSETRETPHPYSAWVDFFGIDTNGAQARVQFVEGMYVDDDIKHSAFSQLEENWRLNNMSMLILLATKNRVFGYYGKGDFNMNEHKQLVLDKENGEFIHIGMTITDYRIFKNHPEKVLQFQNIYQNFMLKDEIYGYIYQGQWLHIGDIRAYNEAPALISPSPDTVSI